MDVSLDIFVFILFLVSRNVYYLIIDVGRIVERRMTRMMEWRTMAYEKV